MPASRAERYRIWLWVTLSLSVRLLFASTWIEAADTANYHRVAEIVRHGGRLYRDTVNLYPYPPLWVLVETFSLQLSERLGVPFVTLVKLPPILADIGIGFVLMCIAQQRGRDGEAALICYLLNPVPIMISSMHGQFDSIPVLCMLLACYLLDSRQAPSWSATCLMLGVMTKSFPILLLPFCLVRLSTWVARAQFTLIVMIPLAIVLAPYYLMTPQALQSQLFSYQGVVDHGWMVILREGFWRICGSVPPFSPYTAFQAGKWVFFVSAFAYFIAAAWRRHQDVYTHACGILLIFCVAYPGIGSQYHLWPLPFLIVLSLRMGLIFSVASSIGLATFYAYRWPEILYSSHVRLGSEEVLRWVYFAGAVCWWTVCVLLLLFVVFSSRIPSQRCRESARAPLRGDRRMLNLT